MVISKILRHQSIRHHPHPGFHVREGGEKFYTETVLRMPADYACYSPPDESPDVASPGL